MLVDVNLHPSESAALSIGLCLTCVHSRKIQSNRDSTFILCKLSQTDPDFPKYPRLPVLTCAGYSPASSEE